MTVLRSILLFVLAALAEIGGAWLVWQGIRERRGLAFVAPDPRPWPLRMRGHLPTRPAFRPHPGRLRRRVRGRLAGLGHAGRRLPTRRYDLLGASLCLSGVAVIMYAPREG
jgi:small multidrug resistance family-3 protein